MTRIFMFGFMLIIFTTSSSYADYHCEVDVHRVLVYGNGSVNVLEAVHNSVSG